MMTPSNQQLAEVAPAVPLPANGSQTYTYRLPDAVPLDDLLYTRVRIPFGRRQIQGVVMGAAGQRPTRRFRIKELKPGAAWQLTVHQIKFARWLSRTMHGSLGFTLRFFFPLTKTTAAPPAATVRLRRTPRVATLSGTAPAIAIEADDTARAQLLAAHAAAASREDQVVIIVPEMHLIEPHLQALRRYLPANAYASYHSQFTGRERTAVWQGIQAGSIRVVVGTQPALWLPYQQLGLAIIDYESFSTHKSWDAYPRLDNRDGLTQLAAIHQAPRLYADRAPSLAVATLMQAHPDRVLRNQPLKPQLTTIATTFADRRAHHLIPDEFIARLKQWIREGERIFVLHNRRGSWSFAICRQCQAVVRCPECDVALSVHGDKKSARLECHHCGYEQTVPKTCPTCHKGALRFGRPAADTVAHVLGRHLPRTRITVIDRDSRLRGQTLPRRTKRGDLIIGTTSALQQLSELAPDRTVFLFPEQSLLYPDFRSRERTLLLTTRLQAAAPPRRRVVLVTQYQYLTAELTQSRDTLYTAEQKQRRRLGYPPYTQLVRLTFQAKKLATARDRAATVRAAMAKRAPDGVKIRGPFESFVKKSRGLYESHLLLSGPLDDLASLYAPHEIDIVDLSPSRIL